MNERHNRQEFYPTEVQAIEALSPKTIIERVSGLKKIIRNQKDMLELTIMMTIISGGVSGGLVSAQQLDAISDSKWYLVSEVFSGIVAAGGVISIQKDRRKKRALEEMLAMQKKITEHSIVADDETLAMSVYDLDLRLSDDQLTNMKKILDSLRQQGLLQDETNSSKEE